MIELEDDLAEFFADEQEIDDEVIIIQRPADLGGYVIVVAVEPFALAIERDEMSRAENVFSFGDSDVITFRHVETYF